MTEAKRDIVSDEEVERVHANANFGSTPKREVIDNAVLQTACGFHNGHTANCIIVEHGLAKFIKNRTRTALTAKGKKYLWAAFNQPKEPTQ